MKKPNFRRYTDSVLKTPLANFGLYAMFALDVAFLAICARAGYPAAITACFAVAFAFECLAIVVLLPVPVLQVGVIRRNVVTAIAFAAAPVTETVWAFASLRFGGAVFLVLAAARFLLWAIAFFLCRRGGAGVSVALSATVLALLALCGAGSVFRFSFSSRPLAFAYREATDEHAAGYAVVGVQYGRKNNVRVPEKYKGRPVVAIDTGNTPLYNVKRLSLPASVTYIDMFAPDLRELTATGDGVTFSDRSAFSALETLRFTGEELPENLPPLFEHMPDEICVPQALWEEAWDTFGNVRARLAPVAAQDEGYIVYYTDFRQPDADKDDYETVFTRPAQVTRGNGWVELPVPDLTEKGYAFDGWYTGRDEDDGKITWVRADEKTRVYAHYYKLYTVSLYGAYADNDGVTSPAQRLTYHYKSGTVRLPRNAGEREGYAFCGWFDYDEEDDPRVQDAVTEIPAFDTGDKAYYAVYKKLYSITVHADGGTVNGAIPSSFHEWTEETMLPQAYKEGYTFMGWFTDPEFTEEVYWTPLRDQRGHIRLRDISLYAKWEKEDD